MPPRKAVPTEAEIQAQCLAYLALGGFVHWRSNTGAARLPGKGGRTRLVRFGTPGVSDILGVLPGGRFLAIEVKRPGGKLSAEQAAFLSRVRMAGGLALVVTSLGELREGLRTAGVFAP